MIGIFNLQTFLDIASRVSELNHLVHDFFIYAQSFAYLFFTASLYCRSLLSWLLVRTPSVVLNSPFLRFIASLFLLSALSPGIAVSRISLDSQATGVSWSSHLERAALVLSLNTRICCKLRYPAPGYYFARIVGLSLLLWPRTWLLVWFALNLKLKDEGQVRYETWCCWTEQELLTSRLHCARARLPLYQEDVL